MKPINRMKGEDETLDTFYLGRILVLQKNKGFRFAVDSPLLADFIQTTKSEHLLELGTGVGIISLLLSIKPFRHITAVEIQKSLAGLARRNVRLNNLKDKISIIHTDLRTFRPGRKFDVIFSNPPYIKKREGHLSVSSEKSIAKHELKCTIFDIMQKTSEFLKKDGRAYFIFKAKRKKDFMLAVEKHKLRVKTVRFVCPRRKSKPNLFLTECDFSSTEQVLLPPFVLYEKSEDYTSEAREIFAGRIYDSTS